MKEKDQAKKKDLKKNVSIKDSIEESKSISSDSNSNSSSDFDIWKHKNSQYSQSKCDTEEQNKEKQEKEEEAGDYKVHQARASKVKESEVIVIDFSKSQTTQENIQQMQMRKLK